MIEVLYQAVQRLTGTPMVNRALLIFDSNFGLIYPLIRSASVFPLLRRLMSENSIALKTRFLWPQSEGVTRKSRIDFSDVALCYAGLRREL
jgi:hypothetical protein